MPRGGKIGNKGGRKSKLTPELEAKIAELLRAGLPFESIARQTGIRRETLADYRHKSDVLRAAESESENIWLAALKTDKLWTKYAWLLERRFRDSWGRNASPYDINVTVSQLKVPKVSDGFDD